MPLSELTDKSFDLFDLSRNLPSEMIERLAMCRINKDRVVLSNNFLKPFYNNLGSRETRISKAAEKIIQHSGNILISWIADNYNFSVRQFERLFKEKVGVSPKILARICRFRKLKDVIDSNNDSLLKISFDLGLTDNSHLTKEFKQFAGITPQEYRSN